MSRKETSFGGPSITRRNALAVGAGSILATGLVPSLGATQQDGASQFFVAGLTGGQRTDPVETAAQGGALFALNEDETELHYTVAVNGLENTEMAHIHLGEVGESGPVVVWLYPAPEVQAPRQISGRFDGVLASDIITESDLAGPLEGESLSALVDEMLAGNTYVNVHTEENPAGEIRGQNLTLDAIVEAVDEWEPAPATETPTPTETANGTETATPTETGTPTGTPTETPTGTPE